MALFPDKEKRAAARSARLLSGWRRSGMGLGVGGSSAILKGVMNLISPFGGPVSLAIVGTGGVSLLRYAAMKRLFLMNTVVFAQENCSKLG